MLSCRAESDGTDNLETVQYVVLTRGIEHALLERNRRYPEW